MLSRRGASLWILVLALALSLDWSGASFPPHISISQSDAEATLAPRSDTIHHGLPERDLNVRITAEVRRLTELMGPGAGSDPSPAVSSCIPPTPSGSAVRYRAPTNTLPYGIKYARSFDARAPPRRAA